MKKSINIGLIIFLLLQACSGIENIENQPQDKETSKNNQKETATQENQGNNPEPDNDTVSTQNKIDDLLSEFPNGIFYNLLKEEQQCLVENGLILKKTLYIFCDLTFLFSFFCKFII